MPFLIILMFISYYLSSFQIFQIGTYGVTYLDLITLAFYLVFFKKVLWDGEKLKIGWHPALIFFFALLITALFSGLTPLFAGKTSLQVQYIKTTLHFIFLGFFTFICAVYPIKPKVWTNVIKTWLILSLIINIFGIYQIFARAYDLPLAWIKATNVSLTVRGAAEIDELKQLSLHYGDFYRATSIFPEPSALAVFNVFILIFTLIPFLRGHEPFFRSKFLTILIFIINIISLFLTFSMTAFVGVMLIIGTVLLFDRSKKTLYFIPLLFFTIIIIITTDSIVKNYAGISVVSLFKERIVGILNYGTLKKEITEGESFGVRFNNAMKCVEVWEDNPIKGSGLGLLGYNRKANLGFSDFGSMTALAEMGIIGLLAFVCLFVTLFYWTGRFVIKKSEFHGFSYDMQRLMGVLLYIMLVLFETNYISGNNLVTPALWVPLGMIFSIINAAMLDRNKKVYEISLVKKPLKIFFGEAIRKYLH